MLHGFVEAGHSLNSEDEREMLGVVVDILCVLNLISQLARDSLRLRITAKLNSLRNQSLSNNREDTLQCSLLNKQRLKTVTRRGVQQLRDNIPRGDQLDRPVRHAALLQRSRDSRRDSHEAVRALLSSLQNRRIAGLDSQTGNVGDDLGPRLKDDKQHADGTRQALQHQAVVQLRPQGNHADGVVEAPDVQDALEHVLPLALLAQVQPRHERLAELAVGGGLPGGLHVLGIGGEDLVPRGDEGVVYGCQGVIPCGDG
ncbi:hypothetical protein VP1G_11061 [Cytospora mali]|uniref:Uncharacterized protein n=1 Tax=Cytospora mali TaxID=578113 RepID=A0A194V3N8_CYTMA|nr:hypothetical protein VP1G_11061 [Valsa mali var. pyri (nom. inval.)]